MGKKDSQLIGVVVNNVDVAGYIRKHGSVSHSKPHGSSKTILYYANPDYEGPQGEKPKDYAGKEMPPVARHTVVQKAGGSTVSSRTYGGSSRPAGLRAENLGNLSDAAESAEIKNKGDLDKEILEIEKREREEVTTIGGQRVLAEDEVPPAPSEAVKGVEQSEAKIDTDKPPVEEKKTSSSKK